MEPDNLNQLRLQQLLQPFNNQTGVMNTTAASPFKINLSDTLTQYNVPNLQNRDLIQQIIAQNQQRFNTADTAPFFFPQGQTMGIPQAAPSQQFQFLPEAYGQSEIDDTQDQEYIDQVKKSQGGGIGGLLKFLIGLAVPGAGILMNLPKGIKSLNQRLQQSDFGQATSLADYLDMRKYGGAQERRDASARTMAQARGLQKQIDQRPSAIGGGGGGGGRDMGASVSRSAAATRSRDLGSMRGGVGR